jgi:outer membrane protein
MTLRIAVLALALGAAAPAFAQQAGEWTFGVGITDINPKSDNGSLVNGTLDVEVDNDIKPTFTAEYFVRDNLGIETFMTWPFEHDIAIAGLGRVGSTKLISPTVSLQYHFGEGTVKPYVGVGVNYTRFGSEETAGPLAGTELELDDSFGLAANAGVDFEIGQNSLIRVNARWIDIDTDAQLNGADIGEVNIDPLVYGVGYVHKF